MSAAKKLHDNVTVYTFTVSSLLLYVGWQSQYLNYSQLQLSMNVEHWSLYDMKSLISSENQPSVAMVSNTCAKILHIFLITKLHPFTRITLKKSIVTQLLKKYLTFYRTQRFISAFTTDHHLPVLFLSQINPVHTSPHHPISWRPTLISIHAYVFHVVSVRFFPLKSCMHLSSLPPIHATCPVHPNFLGFINRIIGKKYTSCISSLFNVFYSLVTSFPSAPYTKTSSLSVRDEVSHPH